jgi:isopentenyl diphosphate isomerase/L-lactate dehydrogenase-like FMN-dependent dehydrogenase
VGLGEGRVAPRIRTVHDARRLARRRVPRVVFDYIDGGAGAESTLRANQAAWGRVQFLPRTGMVVRGGTDLSTQVLGKAISMPVVLAPVGFTRVMDPMGDVAGARAAAEAGTLLVQSTMSGHTMAEVAEASGGTAWFQLYGLGGRDGTEQLLERARAADFGALVLTLDTSALGNRERDLRYSSGIPLKVDWPTMARFAPRVVTRPRWVADVVKDHFTLAVVNAVTLGPPEGPMSAGEALGRWIASPIGFDDLGWIRERWNGPIVAKGLISADDARRAADHGIDAVVVSNHGGRQLDGVVATAPALVEVVAAVGSSMEVYVDGGIRRGMDVVRAVALGARAVLVGRPWVFGLAAAGQPGVARILSILRSDIDRTLRLLGCSSIAELDGSYVRVPGRWGRPVRVAESAG